MSYIPKYILKRMLPKDCVKAVDGGAEINLVNVISPISIDELPENVIDYLEVKIDGVAISDDQKKGIKLSFGGKTFEMASIGDLVGETIPVGEKAVLYCPCDVKAGEEREIDVTIKTDNPMNIKVKRIIQ
jgi:hypothetical protein